jgi:hypothetical protein
MKKTDQTNGKTDHVCFGKMEAKGSKRLRYCLPVPILQARAKWEYHNLFEINTKLSKVTMNSAKRTSRVQRV